MAARPRHRRPSPPAAARGARPGRGAAGGDARRGGHDSRQLAHRGSRWCEEIFGGSQLSTLSKRNFRANPGRWMPAVALSLVAAVAAEEVPSLGPVEPMKLSVGRSVVL